MALFLFQRTPHPPVEQGTIAAKGGQQAVVYLRYSVFDTISNPETVTDIKTLRRFTDLPAAKKFINRKEEARFPVFSAIILRKENGREINLIGYSRDDQNNLKEVPLV